MRLRTAVRCGIALVAMFLFVQIARADGLVRDGLGAISMGRGGTNLGFADNAAIINDNPGAMSNISGNGLFDANADTLITDLHFSNPLNDDVAAKTRPFVAPTVGYIRRIDDSDWTWGVGAFVPAGFGADYSLLNPVFGQQQYKSIGGLGKILPALSYKVTDKLSVGGTFGLAFSDVQIDAPYVIQSPVSGFQGTPTLIGLHSWGVAPTGGFGAQYLYSDSTVFGFNYIAPTTLNLAGAAGVDVPGLGSSNFDAKVHITWPSSISFGVRHNLCPHRIISAEVLFYGWSGAFTNLPIALTNPSNPVFGFVAPNGLKDYFPLNWNNSVSLRTGYQWMPDDVNIYRLGYVYHASPVPNSTLNPLTDGVLVHTFTAGYSRKMPRCQLNVGYQFSFAPTRDVGASQIIGPGFAPGDFANSSFKASIHYLSLGFLVPF